MTLSPPVILRYFVSKTKEGCFIINKAVVIRRTNENGSQYYDFEKSAETAREFLEKENEEFLFWVPMGDTQSYSTHDFSLGISSEQISGSFQSCVVGVVVFKNKRLIFRVSLETIQDIKREKHLYGLPEGEGIQHLQKDDEDIEPIMKSFITRSLYFMKKKKIV